MNGNEGFVPLIWNDSNADGEAEKARVALQAASLQDRNPSWGGDCCDDGCENGG